MSDQWFITCYGKPVDGTFPSEFAAKHAANTHIRRSCPIGPMPWARYISWHPAPDGLVSAAKGEWLNHAVKHP